MKLYMASETIELLPVVSGQTERNDMDVAGANIIHDRNKKFIQNFR
jgi:hypothetical protein